MKRGAELHAELAQLLEGAYVLADDTGATFADAFHQLPPRSMVDYYRIIKTPMSYAKIRSNLKSKRYRDAQGFVNDIAQIGWNARFFNDESSVYNQWGVILNKYVVSKVIPELAKYGVRYPKLGPLPGDPVEEEEEEEEPLSRSSRATPVAQIRAPRVQATPEEEDGDGDGGLPMYHPSTYVSQVQEQNRANVYIPPPQKNVINNKQTLEQWVKRGRPPIVDKPHEQRIKAIMRGLKKIKVGAKTIISFWDKLPNSQDHPDYLKIVKDPISMLDIKGLIKQRYYTSVDQYIADVFKLINNNRSYYTTNEFMKSKLDALETNISKLYQIEMAKPDSEYMSSNQTGRTPLPYVVHNGRTYKVGNWILVRNPNDEADPIVGQIFRLWQEGSHSKMNVCWYYKPEWTVHRYDRLFLDNEVVKTGQYRDHSIEDLLGPCYVAYFTRWLKGDPGVIYEGPLFICEFRYNDREMSFAKIRTWKACLPDEVRHIEDPVKPLVSPRVLRKYPSPIKHMLPPNANSHTPVPQPIISNLNAPPLVGGVYVKRDNDEEDPHYFDATLLATQFKTYVPPTTNIRLPSSAIVDQPIQLQQPIHDHHHAAQLSSEATPQLSQLQLNTLRSKLVNTTNKFQQSLNLQKHNMAYLKFIGTPYNRQTIQWSPYSSSTPSPTFVMTNDNDLKIQAWVKDQYTVLDQQNYERVKKSIKTQNEQSVGKLGSTWKKPATSPLVWFKSPPLKIVDRIINEEYDAGVSQGAKRKGGPVESKTGLKKVKLGHSVKYLQWKQQQKLQQQQPKVEQTTASV